MAPGGSVTAMPETDSTTEWPRGDLEWGTIPRLVRSSASRFPTREAIVDVDAGVTLSFEQLAAATHDAARAFLAHGLEQGDRVAIWAPNVWEWVVAALGVHSAGGVLVPLNTRFKGREAAYILGKARARALMTTIGFLDTDYVAMLRDAVDIEADLPDLETIVVLRGEPPTGTTGWDDFVARGDLVTSEEAEVRGDAVEPSFLSDILFTSGTTGNPKGVLYSHRALFLQAMSHAMVETMGLSDRDSILSIVPMFHANCWCLPFAGTMVGAKQVYPHQYLQPEHLVSLLEKEKITFSAGVPTIWTGVLDYLDREKKELPHLKRAICGGSAVPVSLIDRCEKRGIQLMQGWGMTETSPLGTVARVKAGMGEMSREARLKLLGKQGTPVPCVELRVVDDKGQVAPQDGKSMGELEVRGPWIVSGYYHDERSPASFHDGWFKTGDVATIDAEGYMHIQDRAKDVIKSGGEWVSSVELENAIMGHPKVLEAAVIGLHHPKWDERPVACVVPRPEHKDSLTKEDVLEYLRPQFAKWWLPDDVIFVDSIPKTSVGKFSKRELRDQFKDYSFPA
jgi:fatty-acyl-CoA synthase